MSSEEEGEVEFEDDDDDDDVPLASLKKAKSPDSGKRDSSRRKRKAVDYSEQADQYEDEEEEEEEEGDDEEDDDDDDDDDIPLAKLKKSPTKSTSPKAKPAKKSSKSSSSSAKKKAKPAPVKAPVKSSTEYLSASAALYESDCKKGALIQKLLCRWWYAVTWPDPSTLPAESPKHYNKLNGFEGVYVCTSGDKVGHILDMRDKENCPCFKNYANKSSKELKGLLLEALEEQKRQLIEAEGPGTTTEKEINDEIKWVTKKVKPDEADKEATKVLKAAKMKL